MPSASETVSGVTFTTTKRSFNNLRVLISLIRRVTQRPTGGVRFSTSTERVNSYIHIYVCIAALRNVDQQVSN